MNVPAISKRARPDNPKIGRPVSIGSFNKIVVCGAAGNQGGAVVTALLKSGSWAATALTRDPASPAAKDLAEQGANVVKADLQDMGSLVKAFDGAYGVFGVTQPWSTHSSRFDIDAGLRQGKNIIWACREAGVKQVVMSSVLNLVGNVSGVPWIDSKMPLEQIFRAHLPEGVVIRPSLYAENLGTAL